MFAVLLRSLKFLKDNGQVCICRHHCPQDQASLAQRVLCLRWIQPWVLCAAVTMQMWIDLSGSPRKETACSTDWRPQTASRSKALILSCSQFLLFNPSRSFILPWLYLQGSWLLPIAAISFSVVFYSCSVSICTLPAESDHDDFYLKGASLRNWKGKDVKLWN